MGNVLARADRLRTCREGHACVWPQAMLRSLCKSEVQLVLRGHAHWCLARHMPHATLRCVEGVKSLLRGIHFRYGRSGLDGSMPITRAKSVVSYLVAVGVAAASRSVALGALH